MKEGDWMRKTWILAMLMLMLLAASGAQAEHGAAKKAAYAYYYSGFDWHCSAQYAKLSFEKPTETEYADILMFILNTHHIRDVYAQTVKEVVTGDQGLAVAYCCDALTGIDRYPPHNQYRRINLEDASYYEAQTAGRVRAIVRSGYRHDWTDEELKAAQQKANAWLRTQGEETLENLTYAQAMTATQLAIWMSANSERMTAAAYYGLHDYSRYDVTTYDPVKVPSGVPSDPQERKQLNEANAKNVGLFQRYLLSLPGAPAKMVIFTEDHLVSDSGLYATEPGLHNVTLRFTLDGTVSEQDELMLTVRMGDMEKRYQLGKNATLSSDSTGYYAVTFDGVDAQKIKSGIELTVSGTQVLIDDAYFYEPFAESSENVRDVSQNLVGYEKAGTPTAVFAACTIEVDPEDVVIVSQELVPDTGDRGMAPYLAVLAAALALIAFLAVKARNT